MNAIRCCAIISMIAIGFFSPQITSAQVFTDIAPSMGIEHTVNTIMNIGGSGVCFFDFDNDGWDDITFVQVNDSLLFYKNVNGTFVQLPSFVYGDGEVKQLLWVDYDNDGDNDAFLVPHAKPCKLFRNEGDFTFTDVTEEAGLFGLNSNNHGVAFGDYDRDGFLDFYLCRYDNFPSSNPDNPLENNALFRNNGDGTFTDVTFATGVQDGAQPSFQAIWIDVNRNGWPDLFVINDRVLWGNSLYLNNGDGTFTNFTDQSGLGMFGEDPMSATFADYDNDQDLDILCSNGGVPTKPIRVYQNQGDTTFLEIGQQLGINVPVTFHCTWGATWFDVENTGYMDLYVTTGLLTLNADNETRSYLFMSDSATSFIDSPDLFQGTDHRAASYSVAKGDIDNDGFADLVVQNAKNFNSFIWKNNPDPGNQNNYLKVTLQGVSSNAMAIGSWITVHANGNIYTHYTRCGENFVSQDSQHHIFGLGSATIVDSMIVEYSLGQIDTYYDVAVNQHLYLTEGETVNVSVSPVGSGTTVCPADSVILNAGEWEEYLWNTGHTTQFLTVFEPGEYWVQITNEFGFQSASDTISVGFFENPVVDYVLTHPMCNNDENGSIQLFDLSGSAASAVSWSNGMTGEEIEGLSAGEYAYLYTDINGCTAEGSVLLINPLPLSVQVFTISENQGNDGEILMIINGGTPPYEITLDGDSVGLSISNLSGGQYLLQIEDANGCTYQSEVTVDVTSSVWQTTQGNYLLFPNPLRSGEPLTISHYFGGGEARFLCRDMAGKEWINFAVNLRPGEPLIVDTPALPSGIYLVSLVSDYGYIFSGKLIVH